MRYAWLLLIALALPACAEPHDDTVVAVPQGTVTPVVQLMNIYHDGHLYVMALYQNNASIIHSPACKAIH